MDKKRVLERLRTPKVKKPFVPQIDSLLKFRIASHIELEGTVPVNVHNQGWPVFVYADTYLDLQHIRRAKQEESRFDSVTDKAILIFNNSGCQRLSALSEDINLSIVLFYNNHPIINIHINHIVSNAEIVVPIFTKNEEVSAFCEAINNAKT